MARWQPDAQGRLSAAALELFEERGYEQVTVADIAARAGLTARTFFRHFSDKREVLFGGADTLLDLLAGAVADAPTQAPPLDIVGDALAAVSQVIGGDRAFSRRRAALISAHPELQERELSKLASWSRTLAGALAARGVPAAEADLAAETGVAVFRVGFDAWLAGPSRRTLAATVRASIDQLRHLAR